MLQVGRGKREKSEASANDANPQANLNQIRVQAAVRHELKHDHHRIVICNLAISIIQTLKIAKASCSDLPEQCNHIRMIELRNQGGLGFKRGFVTEGGPFLPSIIIRINRSN